MATTLYDLLPRDENLSSDNLLGRFLDYVAGRQLTLYPAQEEAVLELFEDKNVILNTPTGSGKLVGGCASLSCMVDGKTRETYCDSMSREQLTQEVLALPLAERVSLAQDLWQSIEDTSLSSTPDEERAALAEAQLRDAELTSGAVTGRTHEQVMETMRRAIECA